MKKREKDRETRIVDTRADITRLERLTSVRPPENDTSEIKSKIVR